VASIVGIFAGLEIAGYFGDWRAPFAALAALCVPTGLLAWYVLPPLRRHLEHRAAHKVSVWYVMSHPTHLRAYAVTATLMISSWTIIPFLALYLVHNVGRPESDLRFIWLVGGVATLLVMTPAGWVADRCDKLVMFRVIGVFCLVPLLLITNLPPSPLWQTLLVTTLFMVATSIRWVPLLAMITASAAPHLRGSFMSVNSSVQNFLMATAPVLAGFILGEDPDHGSGKPLHNYSLVGLLAAAAMVASVFLVGRLRRPQGATGSPPQPVTANDAREPVAEPAVS
jgi:predicted MFS family arabinose efflux permease